MIPAQVAGQVRRRFAVEGAEATPVAVEAAVRDGTTAAALGDTAVLRLAGRVRDELISAWPLGPLLAD